MLNPASRALRVAALPLLALLGSTSAGADLPTDEAAVRAVILAYPAAWRAGDEAGVLSLFEPGARISPNALTPIEGIEGLRAFWFPEDGSVTTIHRYELEELALVVKGDLAVVTERGELEFSYAKGDLRMGRHQESISTSVLRRQADGSWRFWRRMWTDLASRERE